MNNKNIIISSILLLISQIGYSQIKEEKLILNRRQRKLRKNKHQFLLKKITLHDQKRLKIL